MTTLTKAYKVYLHLSPFFNLDRVAAVFSHEVLLHAEGTDISEYVWVMGALDNSTLSHDIYVLTSKMKFNVTWPNNNNNSSSDNNATDSDIDIVRTAVPTEEGDFEQASYSRLDSPWAMNTTEVTLDILRYMAAIGLLDAPFPDRSLLVTTPLRPSSPLLTDTDASEMESFVQPVYSPRGVHSCLLYPG